MAQGRVNAPSEGANLLSWVDPRQVGWVRILLIFLPITVAADWLGAPEIAIFVLASLAIVPLAGLIGEATEALASRVGPGLGGLLNATFGNAAELIIALFALAKGLDGVVKASVTGSIIGNLLLVLGASLVAGGLRFPIQRFNRTAASAGTTLMVLAAAGMILPALFHEMVAADADYAEHNLSLGVSVLLMATYGLSLIFSLKTHRELYNPESDAVEQALHGGSWGQRKATVILLLSTALVAWMSEVLVGAVEEASHALGLTEVFVGVIIVAVVGNAAEHSTAVLMAWKNQTDLALGIAMGSALQIALFVAPVLVFASYLRSEPMDLLFTPMEVAAVIMAVLLARMVVEDGESNWLEGAMLLMIYAILGVAFFFLPEHHRVTFGDPIPGLTSPPDLEPGPATKPIVAPAAGR